MSAIEPLVVGNLALIAQVSSVLERCDDASLAMPAPGGGGGIGAQLRHVADVYGCLLVGFRRGLVDYDRRERDARLEREGALIRERFALLAGQLRASLGEDANEPLVVRGELWPAASGREGAASSLGRELHFVFTHAVHHFALVALLMDAAGLEVPAGLGMAPSTARHLVGDDECAR